VPSCTSNAHFFTDTNVVVANAAGFVFWSGGADVLAPSKKTESTPTLSVGVSFQCGQVVAGFTQDASWQANEVASQSYVFDFDLATACPTTAAPSDDDKHTYHFNKHGIVGLFAVAAFVGAVTCCCCVWRGRRKRRQLQLAAGGGYVANGMVVTNEAPPTYNTQNGYSTQPAVYQAVPQQGPYKTV
jgi:hypothetical protein